MTMTFDEIFEKINEWKIDMNNCTTNAMKTLMQQIVTAGEQVIVSLAELTDIYIKNEENYKECNELLQEIQDSKDINAYLSLLGADMERGVEEVRKELENETEKSEINKKAEGIVASMKGKSGEDIVEWINEFINDTDEIIEKVNATSKMTEQSMLKQIATSIDVFSCMFSLDELLFAQCISFTEKAFDYHDYGQWEKIKNAGIDLVKSAILSVSKLFEVTKLLADISNLFDKSAVKKEFLDTTEKNIAKLEGQTDALKFVNSYINLLIQYYREDKYNLKLVNEND